MSHYRRVRIVIHLPSPLLILEACRYDVAQYGQSGDNPLNAPPHHLATLVFCCAPPDESDSLEEQHVHVPPLDIRAPRHALDMVIAPPEQRATRRPTYEEATSWLAFNSEEPAELLVSDLFGVPPHAVVARIMEIRRKRSEAEAAAKAADAKKGPDDEFPF